MKSLLLVLAIGLTDWSLRPPPFTLPFSHVAKIPVKKLKGTGKRKVSRKNSRPNFSKNDRKEAKENSEKKFLFRVMYWPVKKFLTSQFCPYSSSPLKGRECREFFYLHNITKKIPDIFL